MIQAHVTSDQAKKERARSIRWLAGRSRCRPTRNRFRMTPWTERNRCACASDLNRRICRSRCRVGWWETSARLLAYREVSWGTEGITLRCAAA